MTVLTLMKKGTLMSTLVPKVAVITGASQGIGAGLA